jgi:dipeptidase E
VERGGVRIVACGGQLLAESPALRDYVLSFVDSPEPRICLVPTASGDNPEVVSRFEDGLAGRGVLSHLGLFRRTIADVRAHLLAQDVILVSGGNTASMLAVWRAHGVEEALREAWRRGVVLAGSSAGAICWFEDGVTDSFGPTLAPLGDGLGLLRGTFCPHYDTEPQRRPTYTRLVREGRLRPGLGADDHVALSYSGTELEEIVSADPGAHAWRVEASGETPLQPRIL